MADLNATIPVGATLANNVSGGPIVRVKDVWNDENTSLTDLLDQKGSTYTLPAATASKLGGVKIGSGINVTSDGTISVSGGGQGEPGVNGNSIEVRYAIGTSSTTAPSIDRSARTPSGWSTSYDSVPEGKFLWRTEAIINASNAVVGYWSLPMRVTVIDGRDGTNGKDGKDGTNGVSIVNIAKFFYDSDSNAKESCPAETSSEWKDTPSCNKRYIWTKTVYTFSDNTSYVTFEVVSNGVDGTGESAVRLDLSNESAEIAANSDGSIPSTSTRPICTATLKYGTKTVSGATYTLDTDPSAVGVSINSSTGVLAFASNFSFTGTTLHITVIGSGSVTGVGAVSGERIMTVTKVCAGTDGTPATIYWLVLSATSVKVTSDNEVKPDTITVSAMKQTGTNNPVTASDATILYGYDTDSPSTTYSSAITVDKTKDYITVLLKVNGVQRASQTISILKDGNSLQGAIIRGPQNWDDIWESEKITFQSGDVENGEQFIDVIYVSETGKYYYCKQSYTHDGSYAIDTNYWAESDNFDFIATNLLLAKNAKINFLSGNEITLTDVNGDVSAGARAASSSNQIVFWAGGNTASLNSNPFYVLKDGSIKATKGTIGGLTLSSNSIYSTGNGFRINADGSGQLANGEIKWTATGVTKIPAAEITNLSVTKLTSGTITTGGLKFTDGNNSVLNILNKTYESVDAFLGMEGSNDEITLEGENYFMGGVYASSVGENYSFEDLTYFGGSQSGDNYTDRGWLTSFVTDGTHSTTFAFAAPKDWKCTGSLADKLYNGSEFKVEYYVDSYASSSVLSTLYYSYNSSTKVFKSNGTASSVTKTYTSGNHTVYARVTFYNFSLTNYSDDYYSFVIGPEEEEELIVTITNYSPTNVSRGTEIFGNGIGVMTGANKYFVAMSVANQGAYLEMVSGNRGLKVSPTGIKAGFGDGNFYNLSPLAMAFTINGSGTISEYISPYGYAKPNPTVSSDVITIPLPFASGDKTTVSLTGIDTRTGSNARYPQMTDKSYNALKITFLTALTGVRSCDSQCKCDVCIFKY